MQPKFSYFKRALDFVSVSELFLCSLFDVDGQNSKLTDAILDRPRSLQVPFLTWLLPLNMLPKVAGCLSANHLHFGWHAPELFPCSILVPFFKEPSYLKNCFCWCLNGGDDDVTPCRLFSRYNFLPFDEHSMKYYSEHFLSTSFSFICFDFFIRVCTRVLGSARNSLQSIIWHFHAMIWTKRSSRWESESPI